ncbi:HNH endonuclease signature motif containing protein [Microbacterium pumilum]|uniref:DUF222 domain-containing protein n=1 Tax=Microbacterium pumilum TaxID=344165 RepID=A0ABN2SVT4_9MICO
MGHTVGSDGPGAWHELDELVTRVVEQRAAIASLQAGEAALLSEAVDLVISRTAQRHAEGRRTGNDLPLREVCAELGAAMRMSDRTVQTRLGDASTLTTSFSATHDAWRAGRIDAGHVAAILDAGAGIADQDARARYEHQVLDAAAHESPGRLRPLARIVAARVDPQSIDERHRLARARRDVRVIDLEDAMARVIADVPATLAYAILDRITQMAHEVRAAEGAAAASHRGEAGEQSAWPCGQSDPIDAGEGTGDAVLTGPSTRESVAPSTEPGHSAGNGGAETSGPGSDDRSMGELRADILVDLLLTSTPTAHGDADAMGAISGRVQVTIPVLTAAGVGHEPAILAGHGPIDAATARRLAADAPGWDRIMTHPCTGEPLSVDRYRPSTEITRFLSVRDEHCRFPGCRMPVWRCDVDHTVDAALGGATCVCNLANLCRRHHTLKHASDWIVRQLGGGVLEWTSPTRRRYIDRPPSTVSFVPDPAFAVGRYADPPPPF